MTLAFILERSKFIGSPGNSTKTVTVVRLMSIERSNFVGSQGYSTKTVTVVSFGTCL